MKLVECAAGCNTSAYSAAETSSSSLIPPSGWITIGLDVAISEPPYQLRDDRYSAIVCSLDCAISYISRKKRIMEMSVLSESLSSTIHAENETRSDIAKKIGFSILESIEDLNEEVTTILLPLDKEENQINKDVCLAIFSYLPELEDMTSESE